MRRTRDGRAREGQRHSRPGRTWAEMRGLPMPGYLPTLGELTGHAVGHVPFRLTEETWARLSAAFGPPRGDGWDHDGLRLAIEAHVGGYLCWAGLGPDRLNRKRLKQRLGSITQHALTLGAELRAVAPAPALVSAADGEQRFLRHKLATTGSGSWVDWDALLPVLAAVEDAAADALERLAPARRGPWQDDAFHDFVVTVARTYVGWTGATEYPRIARNRGAGTRDVQRWDYVGPFAEVLRILVDAIPQLRRVRGLGDFAYRSLKAAQVGEAYHMRTSRSRPH